MLLISVVAKLEIGDKPPESYLGEYIDLAKKHFIPTDEVLWKLGQYQTFREYRVREIFRVGREIFGDIFA